VTGAALPAAATGTTAAAAALTTFLAVFPAELPDKTMMATLVLTTRFRRPFAVWCGVAAAFTIHVAIAVALGKVLSELPTRPVNAAVAVLFGVGAVVLWRSADDEEETEEVGEAHGFGGIAARSRSLREIHGDDEGAAQLPRHKARGPVVGILLRQHAPEFRAQFILHPMTAEAEWGSTNGLAVNKRGFRSRVPLPLV